MAVSQQSRRSFPSRAFPELLAFLFFSADYLYAFSHHTVFYAVSVLLHVVVGFVTMVLLAAFLFRRLRDESIANRIGWILLAGGAAIGLILIKTGTPRADWNLVYAHILLSLTGGGIEGEKN